MNPLRHNLIVILGPTASGKTRLAARLAAAIGAELISADSRQVYRGMDIGTGKDLGEYIVDGVPVPYHLIDVAEPGHLFSVFEFQQRFYECFREITAARQDADCRGRDGPLHRVDPAGVPDAARTGKRGPERGIGKAGHGGTGRETPSH